MRKRTRGVLWLALLAGSGALVGACASGGPTDDRSNVAGDSTTASDPGVASSSSADVLDVRSGSRMSLALRGGLGPIVSGQSITKATVSLSDLELVDANGGSVALSSAPFTGDLIALQDQLGSIFAQQSVRAGRYSALRFRLRGAGIEAQDAQGATTVYASQGFDTSQFSQVSSVQTLQLSGLDGNGFVTCALPPGGLVVNGDASLALQFAFAQSLTVQSGGAWVLAPRCWIVDENALSSLDVDFQLASSVTSYEQYLQSGFQVMLLDANNYPVCEVPLAVYQSATFRAHFLYISWFQGPFVAALVPPSGYELQSSVAFSVDVQQGAVCSANIGVTSFNVVSGRSFAIGTDNQCRVEQRDRGGRVLAQTSEPIGAVEDVAPRMHHREPVAPGEQPPPPAETPQLPGNPPPRMGHGHGGPMGMPSGTSMGEGMMPSPTPSSTEHGHGMMPPAPSSTSTEHGMMPPAPSSTSTEHGMMPPAPSSTSTEHGMMPPAPSSTSTGHGMMPPAPSSTSTGHGTTPPAPSSTSTGPGTTPPAPSTTTTGPGMPPPAPSSTSTGRGTTPPAPPSTPTGPGTTPSAPPSTPTGPATPPPSSPPPATTGRGGPATGGTGAPPSTPSTPPATGTPSSPPTGGRGPTAAGPTPPSGGPSPSGDGVPSFGGGRGPAGGSAPPSGGGHGDGRGPDTRTH